MKSSFLKLVFVIPFASAACATTSPPRDLLVARASYNRAQNGAAAKYDPSDLYTARKALEAAEQSYTDQGDTVATRDLAYTADRRAQIAEARANAVKATQTQQQTLGAMHSAETAQAKATSAQLGRANQQLALQGQAMQSERDARMDAEKRAAQAAADLAKVASVKQESRGMVITLSGSVLFASSKSDLLPGAQLKLNSVAEALTQQDPDSNIVVEGHTDSQGGMSYNQDLSQRRAQTVCDYLVSRGVASDRITARGYGSTRSVADNGSAEGRANNRRVEIVVEPKGEHTTVGER